MLRSVLVTSVLLTGCSVYAPAPDPFPLPPVEFPPDVPQMEPGWTSLPDRPPVPAPLDSREDRPPYSDALGDVWEEDEENQWRGTWIRRGQSHLFDAYWVHPTGERVLATVEIIRSGRDVEIRRRHPDGQGCIYRGTIARDWVDVHGWYSCSWHRHTSPWRAKIIRMRDVSPALLSNGGWRRLQ